MARIRTVKPDFFRHEALYEAEKATKLPLRVAFAGLWTVADREGRFRWLPRVLKLDVLPFDDCDFAKVLAALAQHRFIVAYTVDGEMYAHIPSWRKHQQINTREADSVIPAPVESSASTCTHVTEQVQVEGEGKGREGVCKELASSSAPPSDDAPPPVVSLPVRDGSELGITTTQAAEWSAAYPGVDVTQELRQMRAWLLANPRRRSTRRGVAAFVVRWLGKEHDRGGRRSSPPVSDDWLKRAA